MLGAALCLSTFVAAFLAYFTFTIDGHGHVIADGLGRSVSPAPWFMRVFGANQMWAGYGWFIADTLIFFIGCIGGFLLMCVGFALGSRSKKATATELAEAEREQRLAFDPYHNP